MNRRKRKTVIVFGISVILILWNSIQTRWFGIFYKSSIKPANNINTFQPHELNIIEKIRKECGPLCDTERPAEIECSAIFNNEYIDVVHGLYSSTRVIQNFDSDLTNLLQVYHSHFNQQKLGVETKTPVWTKEEINSGITAAGNGILNGNYGASKTNSLRDGIAYAPGIKNGRVLVIGSETPWVEACVLEQGASEVVALVYRKIQSKHNKVITLEPYQFQMMYLNGSLGPFDAVVTFSSVEHSGLGRYKTRLTPWGDIAALAQAWCVTKYGGSLTVGIMYDNENDYIRYNAGRRYSDFRFPYLVTNWKQHYRGMGLQRVHVFTKGEADDSQLYNPQKIKTMVEKVKQLKRDCGQLCDTDRKGTPGPFFDHITSPVDCEAIFKCEYCDSGHRMNPAPRNIPPELYKDFTMNNRLSVSDYYFNNQYLGKNASTPVWTEAHIDDWVETARQGLLKGNYGIDETNALRDGLLHAPGVKGGRVLVIGSEIPWVEAAVLEQGSREIVTLEYGKIESQHPKVKTLVPDEFRKSYLNNSLEKFDAIVTFSSLEHSGLGRYGDALNPWGDIIALARGWCVTKDGGSLTIGVMYDNGKDYIQFNAARWYGSIRYPYLTTNWKQHYQGTGKQRVHVFTKGGH